jgi:hypothetical protein
MQELEYYLSELYDFSNFYEALKAVMSIEGEYEDRRTDMVWFNNDLNAFNCDSIAIDFHGEGGYTSCTLTFYCDTSHHCNEWEKFIDGYKGLFDFVYEIVYAKDLKKWSLFHEEDNSVINPKYAPILWEMEKHIKN